MDFIEDRLPLQIMEGTKELRLKSTFDNRQKELYLHIRF